MIATSVSLLNRLKEAPPTAPDWQRFQAIYLPLIQHWLMRVFGHRGDLDDLTQEVFVVVFAELPRFSRQRDGSFRAWLRKITLNRLRSFWRQRQQNPVEAFGNEVDRVLSQLEDPASGLSAEWDQQHDRHVFEKLLSIIAPDFGSGAWEAFRQFAIEGESAARVAAKLGMTENAVLRAKARILKRLREEAEGLID